jgi:hypothetical protein
MVLSYLIGGVLVYGGLGWLGDHFLGTSFLLPLGIVLGAWTLDARRWRIVAKERRHERAQWLAWRAAVGTSEGPTLDPRNIPLIVATGPIGGMIRENALKDAVGLEAVTIRSVEALRAMCAPKRR